MKIYAVRESMGNSDPGWLPLLNALHRDWREAEILKGNDPDPILEAHLRKAGLWPPHNVADKPKPAKQG